MLSFIMNHGQKIQKYPEVSWFFFETIATKFLGCPQPYPWAMTNVFLGGLGLGGSSLH